MPIYGGSIYGGATYGGPAASGAGTAASGASITTAFSPPVYEFTNLLTYEQQTMTGAVVDDEEVSGWVSGANADLERSTEYKKYDPNSLKIVTSPVVAESTATAYSGTLMTIEGNAQYRAFAWLRSSKSNQFVQLGIEWVDASGTTFDYTETALNNLNDWTLVSFTGTAPSSATQARLRISMLYATTGDAIWVDDAVLTPYGPPNTPFMPLLWRSIPEYMSLMDAEQDGPTQPLARFLNVAAVTANQILRATNAFDYIPAVDGVPGYDRCSLVDADYYPTADIAENRWLPWLAFITATRPIDSVTTSTAGTTPWYVLQRDFPTWAAIASLGPITPNTASAVTVWDDIENYQPVPADASVGYRESIRSKGTGVLAGTKEGLKRATRLVLTGIDERVMLTRFDDVATATFDATPDLTVSDAIWIYNAKDSSFDGEYVVASINDNVITFANTGDNVLTETSAYITNREVIVENDSFSLPFYGIVGAGNIITITSATKLPSNLTSPVTITGTTNYNATYTGAVTVAADRLSVTINKGSAASTTPESSGRATFSCPVWGLVIKTLDSQTDTADLVIAAANKAKPAGCTVSHDYTT